MIAMRFTAADGTESVGVWATGSLAPGEGVILAVDDTARSFTNWPAGDKSALQVTPAEDGVEAARHCLHA